MSEQAVQIDGRWSCAGFSEGDAVVVRSCIYPPTQRGKIMAILHPRDKRPEPYVHLESGNSWQGPFDALVRAPSEAIERVARAVCAKEYENPATYWGDAPISDAVEKDWPEFIDTAKVAIEALRIPTEAMLQAGWSKVGYDDDANDIWQAMIDEALK